METHTGAFVCEWTICWAVDEADNKPANTWKQDWKQDWKQEKCWRTNSFQNDFSVVYASHSMLGMAIDGPDRWSEREPEPHAFECGINDGTAFAYQIHSVNQRSTDGMDCRADFLSSIRQSLLWLLIASISWSTALLACAWAFHHPLQHQTKNTLCAARFASHSPLIDSNTLHYIIYVIPFGILEANSDFRLESSSKKWKHLNLS